jgi:hypothetical protein
MEQNQNSTIPEPRANIHFDAFSEPHTIPSGWDVAAFMGSSFESVHPFAPNFQPTGDLDDASDEPENPVP